MCGITGKIRFDGQRVTEEEIARMNAAIRHRGPDDAGVYLSPEGHLGLGSQRLAIIDLSPAGHQPMRFADRYVIVFNGEIYNFQEERAALERAGTRFRSQTDTEVILALYAKYGPRCVQRLRGMFAFAIYDEQEQTLFCARDRLGKKPFKYAFDGRTFLFASELKALLTQPECSREPDLPALCSYLALQYVPAPRTGFRNIAKLPPAHTLFLDTKTGLLKTERYWTLDFRKKRHLTEEEWCGKLRASIEEAVRLRLTADVPMGALLSGGLDSSAVVAFMSRASARPVRTFSVGFPAVEHSELPFARLVAQRFGTEHTELIVEPAALRDLPSLLAPFEEPFGDNSALPTLLLCRLTRHHVTVALTGDGGDENFGGYPRYSAHHLAFLLDRLPAGCRRGLGRALTASGRPLTGTAGVRLGRFGESLALPLPERHARYIGYFTGALFRDLLGPALRQAVAETEDGLDALRSAFTAARAVHPLDRVFSADLNTYLPDDLLTKMDLASMAASLEARSPLLDHTLLELTASMPASLKVRGTRRKRIFRKALIGVLPPEILARGKRGFSLPLDDWFRHELAGLLRDALLSERARRRGLLRPEAVQALIERHVRGGANLGKFLWLLLTLELWFRQYVD